MAESLNEVEIINIAEHQRQLLEASRWTFGRALGPELPILCTRHFRATLCGLEVHGDPSLEECGEYLAGLQTVAESIHWIIGDLMRYMDWRFGEEYVQVVNATGFAEQTLRNDVWVCSKVEPERRRADVSFAVHAEVASLPPTEQDRILSEAQENNLTRAEVRARRQAAQTQEKADDVTVLVFEIRQRLSALQELLPEKLQHIVRLAQDAMLDLLALRGRADN